MLVGRRDCGGSPGAGWLAGQAAGPAWSREGCVGHPGVPCGRLRGRVVAACSRLVRRSSTLLADFSRLLLPETLKAAEARYSRDTLTKALYMRLFDWLVQMINKSLLTLGTEVSGSVGRGHMNLYSFEDPTSSDLSYTITVTPTAGNPSLYVNTGSSVACTTCHVWESRTCRSQSRRVLP